MRWFRVDYEMRFDEIARKVYGGVEMTQKLIRINPKYANYSVLPVGTILVLPKKEDKKPQGIHLW